MPAHHALTPRPPLGWNSFNCFGGDVTEAEVLANAEFVARHLKPVGWDYIVVDFCWAHPRPGASYNPHQGPGMQPLMAMDHWNRLLPAPERFPSSAHGAGFKPLADRIHALGLKFGIHIMRGFPRQAVYPNFPIRSGHRPKAFAGVGRECSWLDHMVAVNPAKPGGQHYYDSLFELYASWGVDYVKLDDVGSPEYSAEEIAAVRQAIDRCGRPMVLSLSPMTLFEHGAHAREHANLWRISHDFWDDWDRLHEQFDRCRDWVVHRGGGAWPDADMLPFGRLSKRGPCAAERDSFFTRDEQRTLMSLWAVFQSPLMMGGHLPETDAETIALLTNPEVLEVNQTARDGHEVLRRGALITWIATATVRPGQYLALFNTGDAPLDLRIPWTDLRLAQPCMVRDLWQRADHPVGATLDLTLPAHGAALLSLS